MFSDDDEVFIAYRNFLLVKADLKIKEMNTATWQYQAAARKFNKQAEATAAYVDKQAQAIAARAEKQKMNVVKRLLKNNVPPKVIASSFRMPLKQVLQIQAAMTP